jgi:glycosyltransferase involved in cell wall biosynthesis
MKDLISIIVPCYNQAQYLDECLQSVYSQTCEDWECIIINDGSPDNTQDVANKWVVKDSRFRYYEIENSGVSSARNFGINQATGNWILPLDGDDKI